MILAYNHLMEPLAFKIRPQLLAEFGRFTPALCENCMKKARSLLNARDVRMWAGQQVA
jgi:hypothetical protein